MMKTSTESGTRRLHLESALRIDLEDDLLPSAAIFSSTASRGRAVAVAVDLGPLQ